MVAEPGLGTEMDPTEAANALLVELEERRARLCAELDELEARLRELRMVSGVCPLCGGTGQRQTRGGLYGERQTRTCSCRD